MASHAGVVMRAPIVEGDMAAPKGTTVLEGVP